MITFPVRSIIPGSILLAAVLFSCNDEPKQGAATAPASSAGDSTAIKEEHISFVADGANLNAYVYYNDSIKGRRPAVLVIPE